MLILMFVAGAIFAVTSAADCFMLCA